MIKIYWLKVGFLLVGLSFFAALPISLNLPFLGFLFFLPFSDAVLLGLSFFISGLVPVYSEFKRVVVLIILWIALSLSLEIVHLGDSISDYLGGVDRGVWLDSSVGNGVSPASIAIEGAANPIVAARGRKWEVDPKMNVGGMRDSMGVLLVNMAQSADVPDMLWARGIESRVGGSDYPRISIVNKIESDTSALKMEYLVGPNKVAASYRRRLPLPKKYPGYFMGGTEKLLLSVVRFNFWRAVLGLNRPVNLHAEIDDFLRAVGVDKRQSGVLVPKGVVEFEREWILNAPEGQSVSELFEKKDVSRQGYPGYKYWEVCGKYPTYFDFGGPGSDTRLLGLVREASFPVFFHHISPDDGIFSFYCEAATKNIIALSQIGGTKPVLRISIYNSDGLLEGVRMFLLPRFLGRDSFIVAGTWSYSKDGKINFQMMEKIRSIDDHHNQVADQNSYRLIDMHAK